MLVLNFLWIRYSLSKHRQCTGGLSRWILGVWGGFSIVIYFYQQASRYCTNIARGQSVCWERRVMPGWPGKLHTHKVKLIFIEIKDGSSRMYDVLFTRFGLFNTMLSSIWSLTLDDNEYTGEADQIKDLAKRQRISIHPHLTLTWVYYHRFYSYVYVPTVLYLVRTAIIYLYHNLDFEHVNWKYYL